MGESRLVVLLALLLCPLGLIAPSHAAGQVKPAAKANPPACRAAQIELYDWGGDAATGHDEEEIGIRNTSLSACVISGGPGFRVIGANHQPVAIPYEKKRTIFHV